MGQKLRWAWDKMTGSVARATIRDAPKARANSIRDLLGLGKVTRLWSLTVQG